MLSLFVLRFSPNLQKAGLRVPMHHQASSVAVLRFFCTPLIWTAAQDRLRGFVDPPNSGTATAVLRIPNLDP